MGDVARTRALSNRLCLNSSVLRHNGLVSTQREGKQVHYRIASPQAMEVMQVLYRLYCEHPESKEPLK